VEKLTGVKGLMDGNLEQHKAFHGGLEVFDGYVNQVLAGKEKYDGGKVVELIDAFGKALTEHLSDEIPTLLALKEYSSIFSGANSLPKKFDEMGKRAMVSFDLTTGYCLMVVTNDYDMKGVGYHGTTVCHVLQRRCRIRGSSLGTVASCPGDCQAHCPLDRLSA